MKSTSENPCLLELSTVEAVVPANLIGKLVKQNPMGCILTKLGLLDVDHLMRHSFQKRPKRLVLAGRYAYLMRVPLVAVITLVTKHRDVENHFIRVRKFPPSKRGREPKQFIGLLQEFWGNMQRHLDRAPSSVI